MKRVTLAQILMVSGLMVSGQMVSSTAHAAPLDATPPAPTAEKPADLPPATKTAVKLAGLVTFVENSCPDLKPDYTRFKSVVTGLGVNLDDLQKGELKAIYLNYASVYQGDVKANCEKARLHFGTTGTSIPGLFGPK